MNYSFGKNICAELVNMRGAAGELLITDEFFTDLDEMDIFVISKDQTFRICATFLDPAKFSILVIHLLVHIIACMLDLFEISQHPPKKLRFNFKTLKKINFLLEY